MVSKYRHGRAVRRINYLAGVTVTATVLSLAAGTYLFVISKSQNTSIKPNSKTPTVTKYGQNPSGYIKINEPSFSMELPGLWKETSRNNDPSMNSIQWNYVGKKSSDKWARIYVDTIPSTFAFNYLLPVSASDNGLIPGQISDNCVNFTQGANQSGRNVSTPTASQTLPARWQQVAFMCDNTHASWQVVGTGSTEGNNAVTVSGPQSGKHQYFFVFKDDNYRPDYSIFSNIVQSFKAK